MGKVIPLYFKEKVRQVFDMEDVQEILFYHLSQVSFKRKCLSIQRNGLFGQISDSE